MAIKQKIKWTSGHGRWGAFINGHIATISYAPAGKGKGKEYRVITPHPANFNHQYYPSIKIAKQAAKDFCNKLKEGELNKYGYPTGRYKR